MAEPSTKAAIQLDAEAIELLGKQVCDDIQQAEIDRRPYIQQVERNRLLLKSYQPMTAAEKPWASACELVIQYVKQTSMALLSHHAPSLLGVDPIWIVEGQGGTSRPMADEMERFLQRQATDQIKVRARLEPALQASLDDGVGIVVLSWRREQRMRPMWERVEQIILDPDTGEPMMQMGEVRETRKLMDTYNGPHLELVPIEDVGCIPAAWASFQNSTGVYIKRSITGDEILGRAKQGAFDAAAVAQLRQRAVYEGRQSPDDAARGVTVNPAQDARFHAAPHEITDCYLRYVRKQDELAEDWFATVHRPTQIVLRAKPTPWWNGKRPIVVLRPFPDKYSDTMGDSIGDLAGDVQRAKTTLIRLVVDCMALGIAPELLVSQSGGKKLLREIEKRRGPRGVIPVPDQYLDKIKPFSPGYVPTVALPVFEAVHDEGERATGVGDLWLGKQAPGQMTAYEASELLQGAQKLVGLQTERLSYSITEIGEWVRDLDYQYQGHESIQRIWALANPDTQLTLFEAMQGDYKISAAGLNETANRVLRAKRSVERLALLRDHPITQSDPRRHYQLYYDTLMETGTRQPERFIGLEKDWIDLYAQMRQAQQQEAEMEQRLALMSAAAGQQKELPRKAARK